MEGWVLCELAGTFKSTRPILAMEEEREIERRKGRRRNWIKARWRRDSQIRIGKFKLRTKAVSRLSLIKLWPTSRWLNPHGKNSSVSASSNATQKSLPSLPSLSSVRPSTLLPFSNFSYSFRSSPCTTDEITQGTQRNITQSSQFCKVKFKQLSNLSSSIFRRVRLSCNQTQPSIYPAIRNPIRAAYLASLESQISSLRDELATVYKTQGQNAQRLLAMNETLREKEELARIDSENFRKAKDELAVLKRKVDQHTELMQEKDRTVQVHGHLSNVPTFHLLKLPDST